MDRGRSGKVSRSLSAPRGRPQTPDQTPPHTPPPALSRQRILRQGPVAPLAPPSTTSSHTTTRQRLVSPPLLRLRPTVTKLPRITDRRRLLISHQPLPLRARHWPVMPLPEQRQAQRQVRQRRGLGASSKSPVYIAWGLGVGSNALVSVLSSPLTLHASDAAPLNPVLGVTCVIATLYDIYLSHKNAKGARHDYLMGAILLQQESATLHALRLEHQRSGHPINPQDEGALVFNIGVLQKVMQRFEAAYYPRSQQPYLQQIRTQIDEAARALAEDIAQLDALARERCALQSELAQAMPPQCEDLLGDLQALDAQALGLQANIAERQKKVLSLLSRRRLRQRALAQLQTTQGELDQAQRLAQARERVSRLASEAAAAWFALSLAPQDAARQHASQSARQALREARRELTRLAQSLAPWQQALNHWVLARGRAPRRPEQADLLRQLMQSLQAQVSSLQQEIQVLRSDWWRGFCWYEDLPKDAIKRLRDVRQQLPRVPLQLASTALSIASLAVEVVGAAFGSYGLTLVSSIFATLMARGDNKDGRLEQHEATLAKLTAWTRLCRASELMAQADGLANEATRALAHSAARVTTVCMQRALHSLKAATTQAQLRRGKGELNYLLIVVSVVGGAAALATGGAAAPFVALPQALLGGVYLVSVGLRAAQQKTLKAEAQGREAVALAFVRAFGIEQVLVFYLDMKSGQASRVMPWRQRLQALCTAWQQGLDFNDLLHRIDPHEFEPEWLWDNEFLFCECFAELMHRHARDQLHGPCAAAELLRALEMAPDVLNHLMSHFAGFPTPAAHRQSTRLHIAAFVGAKPYPLPRLPGHISRRPALAAERVEKRLQQGLRQLSAPTRRKLMDLLQALQAVQAQGEQALSRLTRTDAALRRTLLEWLAGLRAQLQRDFIGPQELLSLQQALLDGPSRDALPPLPLLASAIGPLWLELLADPSYLQRQPLPLAEALPAPSAGPALFADLTAAIKLIGRALRDGDLLPEHDLHQQRPKSPRERAQPSLVVDALRLAPLPSALPGSAPARPPGLARRATHAAFERSRSLHKRLRQTGPNPMSTPAKALSTLQGHSAEAAARICGWVLEQLVRQHSAERKPTLARSPQVMALLDPQSDAATLLHAHLQAWLAAVRATAVAAIQSLRQRPRPTHLDAAVLARLQAMDRLCEHLANSLAQPLTLAQLQGVRLIG